ncbi:putative NAD/FAD-dependent oxidoreductase [Fodinibius salinus]|uniref:Putative NAD/FAD-dependent oxidoreductase n=1 Tax=Fodinibius salinus TaxID=860790 RepID=A0A5D3YQC2_9BACT|nr:FAD-dependent oxidoreductase [Fodinibius salinus]TYP95478.1 putative NAD/FAD-dependent oxidoreductase [Fodinibius salinus]
MVIGIIGAGLSGLVAGKRLADAGHDVTMIEKNRSLGGRLATVELDDMVLDYGISHIHARGQNFQHFLDRLAEKGNVRKWVQEFSFYDGTEFHKVNPNSDSQVNYFGEKGNQTIAEGLSRWVDVMADKQAAGLTYLGPDTSKKRSWMINLTDTSVFECDAVLVATPAVEAYGIIQTVQNRTATRKIIRHIDEVRYDGCMALACTFDEEVPDWNGIEGDNSAIQWTGNESSKRDEDSVAGLVIQSAPDFFRKFAQSDEERVEEALLEEASEIVGSWILQPQSTYLHRWKYFQSQNPIDEYFMELEMDEAPLALIGDYLGGNSLEDAFISGYNLAEYWINKYSTVTA